jgi:hypothetical protein
MFLPSRPLSHVLCSVAAAALLLAPISYAQSRPSPQTQLPQVVEPVPTEKDLAATQSQLIKLLRLSPRLTTVVEHDPSLLSNQEYVSRNNPQLAQFLASHPEIGRNPEFYLFTHVNGGSGEPDEALERAVWPELVGGPRGRPAYEEFLSDMPGVLAFACFLVALVWLTKQFIETRRWSRIFKLQSEVHGKLIDKFSSNQELAAYMGTEAGRRFLEAAPIPIDVERQQRVPNAVARVLTPLQVGIVLSLLGVGFLLLRHASADLDIPMLVLGTVALMPGVGFILSAGVTWVLASRLGLMPENPQNAPIDSREQQ